MDLFKWFTRPDPVKLLELERAAMCDTFNEMYGGDWYFDKDNGRYADNMTTRTAQVFDEDMTP